MYATAAAAATFCSRSAVRRRALSSLSIHSSCYCAPGREVQQPVANTYTWVYTVYALYYNST